MKKEPKPTKEAIEFFRSQWGRYCKRVKPALRCQMPSQETFANDLSRAEAIALQGKWHFEIWREGKKMYGKVYAENDSFWEFPVLVIPHTANDKRVLRATLSFAFLDLREGFKARVASPSQGTVRAGAKEQQFGRFDDQRAA